MTTVRPKELPGSASSHHSMSAFDRFKSVQSNTLGVRNVSAFRNSQASAFPSDRAHQNTHKIEGTVINCPHFRGVCFSQVSARTGSTVVVYNTNCAEGLHFSAFIIIVGVNLVTGCCSCVVCHAMRRKDQSCRHFR